MSDTSKTFLKRLAGFSIGPIVGAFIGFILVPIQTWLIDPSQLGKAAMYTMAFSLTSLFLNLGIDQAYVREYNAEKNKKNLFWNSFLIPFVFSISMTSLILSISSFVNISGRPALKAGPVRRIVGFFSICP